MGHDDNPGGDRRERQDPSAHRHHHALGIGENAHRDGDRAKQEKLLRRGEGGQAHEAEVGEGRDQHEDPHDVGYVVGAQAVRAEGAGQEQAQTGIGVRAQQVRLDLPEDPGHQLEQEDREDRRQDRADDPGAQDRCQRRGIGQRLAEKIPADDAADDGLRGRDGKAELGHEIDRQRRGKGGHEGAGDLVDRAQLAQRMGGPRAAEDGAEDDEDAADDGRRGEADHPRAHRGAEDVRGVVAAERPAEKEAAGQKKQDRDIHLLASDPKPCA